MNSSAIQNIIRIYDIFGEEEISPAISYDEAMGFFEITVWSRMRNKYKTIRLTTSFIEYVKSDCLEFLVGDMIDFHHSQGEYEIKDDLL